MIRVVFSPTFFEGREQYIELSHVIDFVIECMNEGTVDKAVVSFLSSYVGKVSYNNDPYLKNVLVKDIFDKMKNCIPKNGNIILTQYVKIKKPNKWIDNDYLSFLSQYFYYILRNNLECVIILSKNDIKSKIHIDYEGTDVDIDYIFNPYACEIGMINNYIHFNIKNESRLFIRKYLCKHTNYYFKNEIKGLGKNFQNPIFQKYGDIVAERNGYLFDQILTSLNKRRVNSKKKNKKQKNRRIYKIIRDRDIFYISIDYEHGAMELFEHHLPIGNHLGEYNFSCKENEEASPVDHKLYLQ